MPMSNTVGHAYHEKSNSCFPHVPVHMTVVTIVAPLGSPSGRRSSSNTTKISVYHHSVINEKILDLKLPIYCLDKGFFHRLEME